MHIKPKKSLGQNFLIDKNVQRKLIASYELKKSDYALEIGAGHGELTRLIADNVAYLYAIEIDPYLCNILKDNLRGYQNVRIINKDILKFDLTRYFDNFKEANKIKVIGNIPYYITTPIIEHLLKFGVKIETIFITVQKELSKRLTAVIGTKQYSSFSCFLQYYTIPSLIFYIKKNSFFPVPKVDSCLMELKIRKSPPVKVNDEKLLFKIIRAAFNKRRKTLRNSLDGVILPKKLLMFFKRYNIDSNIRPEGLSLEDFANLINL